MFPLLLSNKKGNVFDYQRLFFIRACRGDSQLRYLHKAFLLLRCTHMESVVAFVAEKC